MNRFLRFALFWIGRFGAGAAVALEEIVVIPVPREARSFLMSREERTLAIPKESRSFTV